MKLLRIAGEAGPGYGILHGDTVREICAPPGAGDQGLPAETGRSFALDSLRLLAPCTPSKVVCLGLNYRGHAAEVGLPLPKRPLIFIKPSTAVIGPGEPIVHPPQSRRVDYEAELGVVIGRRAYRVREEEALEYVLGYTCANDITARDLQPKEGQWTYAKSFDTFCPLGPVIETGINDPENLRVQGLLNGEPVQEGSTADHIFPVARLIAYISACMTLLPGDVIMTGTPAGIGPMKAGDLFEVVIEGIGRLANRLVRPEDI